MKITTLDNTYDASFGLSSTINTSKNASQTGRTYSAIQIKLNSVRQYKLIMIHHNKLNYIQLNKLTKACESWQVHMENWPNPSRP
jgi:hypothetical protein